MINCSDLRCKYHSSKDKCTCKKVNLSYWYVHTLYNGPKDFLECKSFEYDEEYIRLKRKLNEILKGVDNDSNV